MLGAMIGDIAGSVYEFEEIKSREFPFFSSDSTYTDDSVMTVAVHNGLWYYDAAVRNGATTEAAEERFRTALVDEMKRLGRKFPGRGYGARFGLWLLTEDREPYNSFGNGSAMRVSPVGFYGKTLEETLHLAELSAVVTHNHPEGIKGAQAVAATIFLVRQGKTKSAIRDYISRDFYPLDFTLDEIRPTYRFSAICQTSVPQGIECFLEADSVEAAVRNCMYIGGDSDTIGAMAGACAEAMFGIPEELREETVKILRKGGLYDEILPTEAAW